MLLQGRESWRRRHRGRVQTSVQDRQIQHAEDHQGGWKQEGLLKVLIQVSSFPVLMKI